MFKEWFNRVVDTLIDKLINENQLYDYYAVFTPTQPPMKFKKLSKANKYLDNYNSQNEHLARYTNIIGYNQKELDDFEKYYGITD